jgi:hypothetical protein
MAVVLQKQQIKHISNLIKMKGVNYIDVNQELTDHVASEVEELMSKNPSIDFMAVVKAVFLKYNRFYFMKIEEEKEKQIRKKAKKDLFKAFISYFTIPKIIFTLFLFFSIKFILSNQLSDYLIAVVFTFSLISVFFLAYYKRKLIGKGKYIQLQIYNTAYVTLYAVNFNIFINLIKLTNNINTTAEQLYASSILFSITILTTLIILELGFKKINALHQKYVEIGQISPT